MKWTTFCLIVFSTTAFLMGCGGRSQKESNPDPARQNPTIPSVTTMFSPERSEGMNALPVLVTMHGMDSVPDDFIGDRLQDYSNRFKVIVVAVSGPVVLKEKQFAWSDAPAENHNRIMQALAEVEKTKTIDRNRVTLLGYSQGAFAALGLGVLYPERYSGTIAISPGSLTNPQLVLRNQDMKKRGFILCYGAKDESVWIKQGLDRMELAKSRGAESIVKVYPEDEHLIPPDLDDLMPKWLDFLQRANSR